MDSEKIIHEYGKVMELTLGYTATSVRFLPYPKDKIKAAIISAILTEKDKNQLEALKAGYIYLAKFLSDENAIVVRRFEDFMLAKHNNISPNHPEDDSLQEKYSKIKNDIAEEMEKLRKVIVASK